ncbi:hypothetical protein HDU97_003925 [Phlyctochytrium planicorne]|nr:hypothetical protein HDU97_003925 [Phlyctochytrium planicorne]
MTTPLTLTTASRSKTLDPRHSQTIVIHSIDDYINSTAANSRKKKSAASAASASINSSAASASAPSSPSTARNANASLEIRDHLISRPSKMTVSILTASLISSASNGQLHQQAPVFEAKLKFRERTAAKIPVDATPLEGNAIDFVCTYHSHCFDKVKVDVFEIVKKRRVHRGRGRVVLKSMEDWHAGTYEREVQLFDPADGTTAVGTVIALFKFSAILLPGEISPNNAAAVATPATPTTPTEQDEESEQAVVEQILKEMAKEEYDDDEDGGSDDEEYQDAQQIAREIFGDEALTDAVEDGSRLDKIRTRNTFLRTGTINTLKQVVENPQSPRAAKRFQTLSSFGEDPLSNGGNAGSKLRSKSLTRTRSQPSSNSSARSPTLVQSPTLSAPRLISENASHNMTEISALTLNMLKHEFPMSTAKLVRAVQLLYRFENGLPIPRTGRIVKDMDVAQRAVRFMKHSLAVYGALVLGFCNGTMTFRDNLRFRADEKTAVEYLGLRLEDVLFWDKTKREIGKAKYYVMRDTTLDAIVVCCQGTIHLTQILTDLNAEYFPLLEGAAHRGILRAAQSIIDAQLANLLDWCSKHKPSSLICTGHSLGAGTAALLTILLNEHLDEFRKVTGNPDFRIKGHCIATPAVANHALADGREDLIDNYVLENDIVPRMSFGSVHNFKEMVVEADRILGMGVEEEESYRLLQEKRVQTLMSNRDTRGIIPGRVFHIYKTVRRIPRRHHKRLQIQTTSIFEEAYRTVNLPPEERPEVPHYVMELARPELFAFVAPRRHIFNHHLPWAYSKGVWGVLEWLEGEGEEERREERRRRRRERSRVKDGEGREVGGKVSVVRE